MNQLNWLEKSLVMEYIEATRRLAELHANMIMLTHFHVTHKEEIDVSLLMETQDKLRKRIREIRIELDEA